nr:hypothetical protein [Massilia sp. JS1662]
MGGDLELRALGGATIRRKLSALSSLFQALCEANAVQGNPVEGPSGRKSPARKAPRPPLVTTRRALVATPRFA